ncbi:GntR family transcriptional regulator [Achromobacter aloeverae]
MHTLSAGVPMYHQIAQVLRRRLEAGDLGAGNQMATEQALCEEFGVSRTTVRHALSYLKREGLLSSRRGVGTRRVEAGPRKKYVRSTGDPLHATLSSKPRILSLGLAPAPAQVARFLGLEEGAEVFKIVRMHDLDGEPLSVVISYMPAYLSRISRSAMQRETLHEIFWHDFGLKVERSVHTIRVSRADTDIAALLKIGLADPVMHIQAQTFLRGGQPIRWTENYFCEDRYEYTAEFIWDAPAPRRKTAAAKTGEKK